MPKINLPELDALSEYLTGKVPRLGMFSTLKGLIDNSPRPVMTAQEWAGYLKPGQVAMRQGVEFPLQKEELTYSKIPEFLAGFKPNEKLTREQIQGQYMAEAPNLNVRLGSNAAYAGHSRESQALDAMDPIMRAGYGDAGITSNRVDARQPKHSQYSHASRGDLDEDERNTTIPWGSRTYQEDITKSPDFGVYDAKHHFDPTEISWNRTNRVPLWGESTAAPPGGKWNDPTPAGRTMKLIEEIQSDRHQSAIKPGTWNPTPENLQKMQELANDLMTNPGPGISPMRRSFFVDILRNPTGYLGADHPILQDPRWQELQRLREASKGKVGYQTAQDAAQLQELESRPEAQDADRFLDERRNLTFNAAGEPLLNNDPAAQAQVQDVRRRIAQLKAKVPDTPFKKTQGYVGLEMRKALTDAVHSGDSSLGLVTGADQDRFYGHNLNDAQRGGQNYAYDTAYPSVLKDLARQMGLKYGPQDVILKAEVEPKPKPWPPSEMRRMIGDPRPEIADQYTIPGYIDEAIRLNANRGSWYNSDAVRNLWHRMYHQLPDEIQQSLGAPVTNPETGLDEGLEDRLHRRIDAAQVYGDELQNMKRPVRQHKYDRYGDVMEDDQGEPIETQQWQDLMRSREYQNAQFNYRQALQEAGQEIEPTFQAFKKQFGPGSGYLDQPDQGLRKKTFQNAMEISPEDAERIKAAGVPVWKTGGQVDHVRAAMHRLNFGGGGKVSMVEHITQLIENYINKLHEVSRVPPEQLTDQHLSDVRDLQQGLMDHGINPEALENQVMRQAGPQPQDTIHAEGGSIEEPDDSSLTTISRTLGKVPLIGKDLQRIGTRAAQQFYGLDKKGHVVAGGRAWTEKQGGTPMALLDEAAAAPGSIAGLVNTLKNAVYDSTMPGLNENPEVAGFIHGVGSIPTPQFSKDASERLGMLEDRITNNTGVGPPRGWRQNAEDMAGNMLTPVPMTGALKEANAARRAMEFMIPVRPSLKRLPMDSAVLGGISTAAQALEGGGGDKASSASHSGYPPEDPTIGHDIQDELGEGAYQRYLHPGGDFATDMGVYDRKAEGGQPEQPMQPEAPTEDSLLNDMLQRRVLMRQSAPALPMNLPSLQSAEGGKVGLAEQLMQLVAKLTGGSGGERLEARVPPPAASLPAATSADAAHASNIMSRDWSKGMQPSDIFQKFREQNPDMASHADDIEGRNWTSIYDEGVPMPLPKARGGSFPTGGRVEGNVDPSSADWHDIRRRLAILQNPVIQGKPPGIIPPLPKALSSEEAVNAVQRQQALDSFNRMMGHDLAQESNVDQEQLGPMHFSSNDTELLDLLKAKLLGQAGKVGARTPYQAGVTDKQMAEAETPSATDTGGMAEGGTTRRGFLTGLAALVAGGAAKMNSEKLAELEKTILGAPKEEASQMTKSKPYQGGDGPVESTIEGSHRRYIPVITDRADSPITLADTGLNSGTILKSDYLGSNGPHHMHRVLVEAPADELLDHHLATVDGDLELAHGVTLQGSHSPEDMPGWERWSERASPESHPVHQALQGAKDEIFGAGENNINWERVGHHLDAIPDSPMKRSLDAELENLRDLEMSGEELDSGSVMAAHQALDDLAAEHGTPIARHPNP